jgi:membrane-associated protease RseP (regulator of RpoE activity)
MRFTTIPIYGNVPFGIVMDALKPEDLKHIAGRHFTVVGIHYDEQSVFLPVAAPMSEDERDANFDALRRQLMPMGYVPMLVLDQKELGIYITRRPPTKYRGVWVNLVMLCLTIVTTIIAGALSWASYEKLEVFSPKAVAFGSLFFSLPLMLILGVHELSHYMAARRHGVAASLPFFIPAFPPLGTFGAFISMRDPIPDRKALMDIGVAGPLAGFVMTIFVTIAGIYLTNYYHIPSPADTGGLLYLGTPIFFELIGGAIGYNSNWILHPTAFAGWVGFLVTSLNLLPAGQLDGGHVARAFLGERAKYAGWAAILVLVILSLFSGYPAWIVFILLILFLGLYHPPPLNDLARLDLRRKGLGALAVIVLFGAFIPVPLTEVPPVYGNQLIAYEVTDNAPMNGSANYTFLVVNTGNSGIDMILDAKFDEPKGRDLGWTANLSKKRVFVDAAGYRQLNLSIGCPPDVPPGNFSILNLSARPAADGAKKSFLEFRTVAGFVRVSRSAGEPAEKYALPPVGQKGAPMANFTVTVSNLANRTGPSDWDMRITNTSLQPGWSAYPDGNFSIGVPYGRPVSFDFSVWPPPDALMSLNVTYNITVMSASNSSRSHHLVLTVTMGQVFGVGAGFNTTELTMGRGENATVEVFLNNTGNGPDTFGHTALASPGLLLDFPQESVVLGGRAGTTFNMTIYSAADAVPGLLSVQVSFYSIEYRPAVATVTINVNLI